MQKLWKACLLSLITCCVHAQAIERNFSKTLVAPDDKFSVRFSNYPETIPLKFIKNDTTDMGTDGSPGLSATILYGNDSVTISYTNLPYAEVFYVPLQSPSGTSTYRLHFNGVSAVFSSAYHIAHEGKVFTEIPEVYELANIIWLLSPAAQKAKDLIREGDYYQQVIKHFTPFINHPLFKKLDFPDSLYFEKYYDFRENSFAFSFKGDALVYEGPYYYVTGNDWDNYNSLFRQLAPMVEDFAKQSGFRRFYQEHQTFYNTQIKREEQLLPVNNMWQWLEKEFPGRKYQSYKVVFSPLIGGSHSTQNFCSSTGHGFFCEAVMFICGTQRYEDSSFTEKQKEGLMSGIVFTEIDHNYVNPVSGKYGARIDSIFSARAKWTATGGDNGWYASPESVFNEYMTHAVFCLWVKENYDAATAEFVIANRERLMTERRHFSRFKEFNRALLALREQQAGTNVAGLYPAILDWCSKQL